MIRLIRYITIVVSLFVFYTLIKSKVESMSSKSVSDKPVDAKVEKEYFDADNLVINMGGRSVPFSEVNKPHNVVLGADKVLPKVDPNSFPPVEKEAKEREDALQAQREQLRKDHKL